MKEAVNKHVGVRLEWHGMTEDKLEEALLEVLTNPGYQSAVDQLSELIMDQPQHPLDRAVWWLEYLLRHPHNTNMRPHTHNLYWFQYFLLDVLAVFLFTLIAVIVLITKLLKCCCSREKNKNKTE